MNEIYIPHLDDTIYVGDEISLDFGIGVLYKHVKVVGLDPCEKDDWCCSRKDNGCSAHCALILEGGGNPCLSHTLVKVLHHKCGTRINKVMEL